MTLSLRYRIYLTLVPLLVLLASLGAAGVVLLSHLGGRIDAIRWSGSPGTDAWLANLSSRD